MWMPLKDNGQVRSTGSGTLFTKLSGVIDCCAIGFGKAATTATRPTTFFRGALGDLRWLFRSTDTGANWTRINDDVHQYGTWSARPK